MKVYVNRSSNEVSSIHHVLKFFYIDYELYPKKDEEEEPTGKRSPGLYLDNIPTPNIFRSIYERPLVSFITPGCTYISESRTETIFLDPGEPDLFNYIGRMDSSELYWLMIKKYWYEVSETWVKQMITPNWLYTIQKQCLIENKRVDDFDWVNSQAFFCRPYQREVKEGTLNDAISDFLNSKPSDIVGREYLIVDIPRYRLHRHPLTLPGVVTIRNHEDTDTVITTVTVVTHFYDLKLSNKPLDYYYKSLEYFAKILHPVIFYGDRGIIDKFKECREEEGLSDYTTVIEGTPEDWKIFDISYPYETITCLKPYVVEDAIRRNPYLSDNWVYMDCGTYKYREFPFMNSSIFSRVPFSDRLRVWGMTSIPVCDDSFNNQAMIASIMMGSRKAWEVFNDLYFKLLSGQEKITKAEQYYMTRVITLRPDIFDVVVSSLHQEAYANLLNLE